MTNGLNELFKSPPAQRSSKIFPILTLRAQYEPTSALVVGDNIVYWGSVVTQNSDTIFFPAFVPPFSSGDTIAVQASGWYWVHVRLGLSGGTPTFVHLDIFEPGFNAQSRRESQAITNAGVSHHTFLTYINCDLEQGRYAKTDGALLRIAFTISTATTGTQINLTRNSTTEVTVMGANPTYNPRQGKMWMWNRWDIIGTSVASGTWTTLEWDNTPPSFYGINYRGLIAGGSIDVGGGDTTLNSALTINSSFRQRIYLDSDSIYMVNCTIFWQAQATGVRNVVLRQIGATDKIIAAMTIDAIATTTRFMSVCAIVDTTAQTTFTYIQADVFQNSGVTMNPALRSISVPFWSYANSFSAIRLGDVGEL